MLFKILTLIILTTLTLRQAIIATLSSTSYNDNKMALILFPTVTMWVMVLGVI